MTTPDLLAALGAGGLALGGLAYFAYQALASARAETQAVRDLAAERDKRRDAEIDRDHARADLAAATADLTQTKAALAAANAAHVAAADQGADDAKRAMDAAHGADLLATVERELRAPAGAEVPGPAAGDDHGGGTHVAGV